jgi:hypothetical protein
VAGKEGIDCSQKPIGCTLDDRVDQKLDRETGLTSLVPITKSNSFIGFEIELEST